MLGKTCSCFLGCRILLLIRIYIKGNSFTNPQRFIFTVGVDIKEWVTKQKDISKVLSKLLLQKEKIRYERIVEMQKSKEIFLSHKSADKPLVRIIADTLSEIGFSPWLDEDKMKAGVNLERGIRSGFEDSCAAVFFITPNFTDEGFLATEIDYALAEKRKKGERFVIITLLLEGKDGNAGVVPEMLHTFVWKQVKDIEIILTILEALPVRIENIVWRH